MREPAKRAPLLEQWTSLTLIALRGRGRIILPWTSCSYSPLVPRLRGPMPPQPHCERLIGEVRLAITVFSSFHICPLTSFASSSNTVLLNCHFLPLDYYLSSLQLPSITIALQFHNTSSSTLHLFFYTRPYQLELCLCSILCFSASSSASKNLLCHCAICSLGPPVGPRDLQSPRGSSSEELPSATQAEDR